MAVTAPAPLSASARPRLFWSRLHFVIRLLGLSAGLLACAAAVLAAVQGELRTLRAVTDAHQVWSAVLSVAQAAWQAPRQNLAVILCLAGAATALVTLLVELVVVLAFTATRRSAFGFNAVVQGVLAAVALIAVNLWSFHHAEQVDFTRDRQFTLPAEVRKDLAQLRPSSPTTIIVYNRHKVFASQKDVLPDEYDVAAERKVIDKVRDLVEQFRGLGSQIEVQVLDSQSRDYKFKERLRQISASVVRGSRAAQSQPSGDALTGQEAEDAESLRKTIEAAPENSLFFCGRDNNQFHVQQLSFNEFYLLDKSSGQNDREGRGNLVLLDQGVEPFARRLLRLGEKKPRIAIATIHDVLSTESEDEIGMRGLRAALEKRGFEIKDIILKKWGDGPLGVQPVVYSLEESKLESLKKSEQILPRKMDKLKKERDEIRQNRDALETNVEDKKVRASLLQDIAKAAPAEAQALDRDVRLVELAIRQRREALERPDVPEAVKAVLRAQIKGFEEQLPSLSEQRDLWKKAVTDEKTREMVLKESIKRRMNAYDTEIQEYDRDIGEHEKRLQKTRAELSKLDVSALEEQRLMTDLQAKLQRLLADCDLVMVPRLTLVNTAAGRFIPPQVYPLDNAQVEAIKEFLKAGKPVLACFGPLNVPTERFNREPPRPDGLEEALEQLGVKLGKQTILFNAEEEGFDESRPGISIAGAGVKVPPLIWNWPANSGLPFDAKQIQRPSNRIRDSLRLTARGLGKDVPLELRIRDPRPIYYVSPESTLQRQVAVRMVASLAEPSWANVVVSLTAFQRSLDQRLNNDAVFLMTSPQSWNEDNPFPSDGRAPEFEKPKRDKDKREPLKPARIDFDTRRRGPFPIGIAVETTLPHKWYDSAIDKPARVRLAVIGHGGFFTGTELPDAQEKVLVHTIDWLLGRDDRLPHEERVWSYPRVNDTIPPDSPNEYLWLWGVRLGLPALFAYFGLVVLLFRRLR